MCCLLYPSGRTELSRARRKIFLKTLPCSLMAKHFACEPKDGDRRERSIAVTLIPKENYGVCNQPLTHYIAIDYSYKHEGIAIFAKILFGNLSARDLITWLEVHRLLGFNKVYVYPYQLNSNATRVLQYYERIGLLEILPYTIPGPEHGWDLPPIGTKNSQGWNYKQVALMDGFERLKGYKYIISFDVDEYIVPRKNESLMELFDRLFREKKDAAGFYLSSYIHIKNWEPTNKSSLFTIGRYLNRTRLTPDRKKHVVVPSRITEGGFSTHEVYPKGNYKTYMMKEDDAALHHFRSCRLQWLKNDTNFPCYGVARYHDDTVNSFLKKVEDDVLKLVLKLDV